MTQALLSLNADSRTTSPARNSSIFKMSDGALVAIWVEGINGPGTDRVVRRYRSEDGVTWYRLSDLLLGSLLGTTDPDGSKQIYPLFSQPTDGSDTIGGFAIAVPASATFMFVMNYSAVQKDFTSDTLIGSYTPTNAWDGLPTTFPPGYTDYGKALYNATDADTIVVFHATVGGQEYIYIVIWDSAVGKLAEARFTNAPSASCSYPDFAVNTASPRKIFLTYQRGNYEFRSYTWDGATLTAADAAEVIPGTPTITGAPRCFLNANGNLQIVYENFTTNPALITRERTGVATYSAAVEIATDLPYGTYLSTIGWQDHFAIKKVGTDDFYIFYKKTTTNFRGELYYVRRNAGVWGAQTAWKTGANGFNHPSTGPFVVGADHKLHMLFSRGSQVYPGSWSLFYDFLYDGTPSAPTNITPITRGETSATPTITAKYKNNRAGDSSSKVRVRVLRSSDASVFWDLGGASGTAAVIAVDGTYSVVYAGTALVEGTDYYIEINFWDGQESYAGPVGSTVATPFAWNDPPSKIAVALTSDPTNGKQRTALYPLVPASATTEKAPALGDLWRKLSTDAQFTSLKSGLAFTAPTTQSGFSAYRQCPEKIGRNLVVNGGFIHGLHGWTLTGSTEEVIADTASPSGYVGRGIRTSSGDFLTTPLRPCEAGTRLSFSALVRSDGVAAMTCYMQFFDAAGAFISQSVPSSTLSTTYVENGNANVLVPGNARTFNIHAFLGAAGIGFITAVRVMQQTAAPAAWTAAHQQYLSRGLAIYEASTNLAADGDMEAVGVASYTAVSATLTKETGAGNFFAGAKSLKVASTGVDGRAEQTGALGAGQAVTASVRVKGGDATCRLRFVSTPSTTLIGEVNNPNTTNWNTLRVSGAIAGGDTGWQAILVAGANTVVAYFDNFAVENKAYDSMNADPSGQAFALAARTASGLTVPIPAAMDRNDWAIVMAFRPDVGASTGHDKEPLIVIYTGGASDFIRVTPFTATTLFINKFRSGVSAGNNQIGALSFVVGDTVVIALRFRAGTGMKGWGALNGGAISTVENVTPEGQLTPAGALSTINLSPATREPDATVGVVRILKAGATDAQIAALVADPYQQPTDNDLAVWQFEGFASQVPVYDDRLVKLGSSYDFRAVGTAAAATPTQSTGQQISGSVAASAIDAWWLRDAVDATKDVQLYVAHEAAYAFNRGRPFAIGTPLQGGPRTVTLGALPFGDEGTLRLIYPTAALRDATELALKAFLASSNATYLQDPFGGLRKVRISAPIRFAPQLVPAVLEADLEFIEVP